MIKWQESTLAGTTLAIEVCFSLSHNGGHLAFLELSIQSKNAVASIQEQKETIAQLVCLSFQSSIHLSEVVVGSNFYRHLSEILHFTEK